MIRKLVISYKGNINEIEDLLGDALIAFLVKLEQDKEFKLTCSFSTFIYSICRNLLEYKLRHKNLYSEKLYDTNTFGENIIDDYDIDLFINDSKKYRLYLYHFSKITELCQKIIQMFLDKMSIAEIAVTTGVTENSAKQRNYDCKNKLVAKIMNDPEFEEIAHYY